MHDRHMQTAIADVPQANLLALASELDPYPRYAGWRRQSPLVQGGPRQWGVTRHADVSRLLRDPRVRHHMPREYVEFAFGDTPHATFQFNSIVNQDGTDHARLRRLMGHAFSPSLVRQLRSRVTRLVDELLAPLKDGAPFDVVDDLAFPLPSQVICELLGLPIADRLEVGACAAGLTDLDRSVVNDAVVWLRDYIDNELAGRQPDPDGDLLQRMLAAGEGNDALAHDEIVDNAALLFIAGFETTKHLISSGCAALLTHPDQRDRLWTHPAIARTAVEEMLRFDGLIPFVTVFVHEPLDVGPHTIDEGDVLYLLLGSANHDDDVFDDPTRLNIERDPNPHVSLGGGPHFCLGAMLARLEAEICFTRLAESMRTFDAAGEPERRAGTLASILHVPVTGVPR